MAVLSEAETRHFPQTRDPSLEEDAGSLGAVSSSHPQPTTR